MSPIFAIRFIANVIQVYEFHKKSEKLKKKKLWIPTNRKVARKVKWENLQRDNYHAQSTSTFRTQSNILDETIFEHGWVLVPRLKLTIKCKRLVKKAWKRLYSKHSKVNIVPVLNECGGHIWDELLNIWWRSYSYLIKSWKRAK